MNAICHRCQHTWRPKGKFIDKSCPKCGSEYVGPTKGSSFLGSLIKLVVVLGLIGAAGYMWAKKAKEAPQADAAAAKTEAASERGKKAAPKPKPTAAPTEAAPKPKPTRAPKPKPTPTEAAPKPDPEPTKPAAPTKAKVKVVSQAGVDLGGSYMVRGAVKNVGGKPAEGVKVEVRFYAGSKRISKQRADVPSTLAPDERASFKVTYDGPGVTRYKIKVRKKK